MTHVEEGCTCGGMAACQQCQERDAAAAAEQEPWTYEAEKYENHGGADVFHHVVAGTRHIAEVEVEEDARQIIADRQAVERVRALMADPWEAHNWGEMARYQEGVTRRGGVRYGKFVALDDLRFALDYEET